MQCSAMILVKLTTTANNGWPYYAAMSHENVGVPLAKKMLMRLNKSHGAY